MAGYHCILLVHRNLQDSRVNKYDAVMLNGSLKSTVIVVMGNFVCEILCSTASDDSWRGASPKTTQKTTPKSTPKTTPKRTPNSQKCKMAWTYGWYWGMCRYRQSWTRIADIRVHTRIYAYACVCGWESLIRTYPLGWKSYPQRVLKNVKMALLGRFSTQNSSKAQKIFSVHKIYKNVLLFYETKSWELLMRAQERAKQSK